MKTIKVLFFTILLSSAFLITKAQPVKDNGQLAVKGTKMVNEKGDVVMLKGISYGWHNWWPRFYNESTVKWLAEDWNCEVLRAAMGVEPEKGYMNEPEWSRQKTEAIIKGAIDNDIYVIIDWHSHGLHLEPAKDFFLEMAEKYGNYPNVIYEIFNEPVHDSWEDVKAYSIEVIKVIRDIDPDN
ncbi:MAG: cellulase family glycosylhydrolase, partial [Bacteroidales bacterium]